MSLVSERGNVLSWRRFGDLHPLL